MSYTSLSHQDVEINKDYPNMLNQLLKEKRDRYDLELEQALTMVSEAIYAEIIKLFYKKYAGNEILHKHNIFVQIPINQKNIILKEVDVEKWRIIREKVNNLLFKHHVVCISQTYLTEDECDCMDCMSCFIWKKIQHILNLRSTMWFQSSFVVIV